MSPFYLSDPHRDFTHPESRELLRCIIAKQGVELSGYDLCCVFNGHMPAGTPAECCAYLPPLYHLLRRPQNEYALRLWEDIIWIWLVQNCEELIALNRYRGIIDELRGIVHDTLVPAQWQPEQGAQELYRRAHMLMIWMACPQGQDETGDILNALSDGDAAHDFILLRMYLAVKASSTDNPLGIGAPEGAFALFSEHFENHFRDRSSLYDAVARLLDFPLPPNDAAGSTIDLKSTLTECSHYQ